MKAVEIDHHGKSVGKVISFPHHVINLWYFPFIQKQKIITFVILKRTNIFSEPPQLLLFVGYYVLLNYGYFKIPIETFRDVIYYHGVSRICADLINWISPDERVWGRQNHILSTNVDLEIVRGCDGAGALFLLIAAISVFPSNWQRKLFGIVLGFLLIYGLNLLRVCMLYFVITYNRDWFLLFHAYLAPSLMVITACGYFAWWAFVINNACKPA